MSGYVLLTSDKHSFYAGQVPTSGAYIQACECTTNPTACNGSGVCIPSYDDESYQCKMCKSPKSALINGECVIPPGMLCFGKGMQWLDIPGTPSFEAECERDLNGSG